MPTALANRAVTERHSLMPYKEIHYDFVYRLQKVNDIHYWLSMQEQC